MKSLQCFLVGTTGQSLAFASLSPLATQSLWLSVPACGLRGYKRVTGTFA